MAIKLFTIGFTKKSAERFFDLLQKAGVRKVVDTRLQRTSQLSGFAKEQDLPYLLHELCGAEYEKEALLAPTGEILNAYKTKQIDWNAYESRFTQLLKEREIEKRLSPDKLDHACLLCSEDKPHHCHRRLVAEYLKDKWGNLEIEHL